MDEQATMFWHRTVDTDSILKSVCCRRGMDGRWMVQRQLPDTLLNTESDTFLPMKALGVAIYSMSQPVLPPRSWLTDLLWQAEASGVARLVSICLIFYFCFPCFLCLQACHKALG